MNSKHTRPARAAVAAATIFSLAACLHLGVADAQEHTTPRALTLERIMAHPDWLGRQPETPYWADDSQSFYYSRKRPRTPELNTRERQLFQADLEGEPLREITPAERGTADSRQGGFNRDRTLKTYARAGDVFVKDFGAGLLRQLTKTHAAEQSPLFLIDGRVAYRRGNELFARDLQSGLEEQLFDLRTEKDPIEKRREEAENPDYLRDQQPRLFRWIREGDALEAHELEEGRRQQSADPTRADLPWYLGDKSEIRRIVLSPAGDWVLVVLRPKQQNNGKPDRMPRYVSDTGYVEPVEVRSKVGTAEPVGESAVLLRRSTRERFDLDLSVLPGIHQDPLAELRRLTELRKKEAKRDRQQANTQPSVEKNEPEHEKAGTKQSVADQAAKARPLGIQTPSWSEDGQRVAFQARAIDNKDRWIASVDLATGAVNPLHRLTDPAWINWRFADLGWLRDSKTLYFLSEESGYSQLYLLDIDGGQPLRITNGDAVVNGVVASPDGKHLYYTANKNHPGIYEVHRSAVDGSSSERLTDLGGQNAFVLSPDGEKLLITHSSTTRPPELYVQSASPGAQARRVTATTSSAFLEHPWTEPRIVEVPSSTHDRAIYSRLYLPGSKPRETRSRGARSRAARGGRKRPAVMFVHGAGYLQNAHQGWSGYFREFMFHSLLVERGYVVLDMDYRASAGYGRDWRTAIYRQMGTPEVQDLKDGVAFLAREHNVDPKRVGVYGGSYGGFLALMALFTEPELFAAGAALRPVTDWAHYNHGYTSNILNTPSLDPEAYERSSPIEFAETLNKPLLICTGMLDDNVFFQDSVRLVQRLIELEKENWEIAIYPVEPHGFREPSSWLDEYRRILKLFETHLSS